MKICPKCGQAFDDDSLSFCLNDGTPLVAGESQPTVVMPPAVSTQTISPPRKKRRTGLWITLGVVVLLAGGAALAGLLFYAYRLGNQSAKNGQTIDVNISTPRPSPPTRSSPMAASPTVNPTRSESEPVAEDVTPISWTTSATTFKQDAGLAYKFQCSPEGTAGTAWGSDVYTADSSICTAAVHAGKITLKDGGEITIEFIAGRQTYGATTRNGITSYNFGQYPHSFVFR